MTGCCRNGSWPSRGQDNNLPAIYYSSSFSDRKKAAKNTPCIFMVCFVTLGSHIVPPPAWRRVHTEFRPGYSGFCPIRSGEFPKLEILQPFYASPFQCLPHLTVKRLFLVSSWNFEYFVVQDPRVPGVIFSYFIMFLPWKNSSHGCCSCSLHGPCCCVFAMPEFNFLGKLLPLLPAEI